MPILPVRNVGANGIILDIPSVLLPVEGWSDGKNVRFDNGSVSKMLGHTEEFSVTTEPELVQYWPRPVTPYYITAIGNTVMRRDTSGNSASLVPSGTTFSSAGRWRSSLFNGGYSVIMNNGVDKPQYITYGTNGSANEVSLQPLPGWPDNLSAQVVVGHNYAMIAGNLRDTSGAVIGYQSGTIRISSQAAPGGVPASWTIGSELLTTADEFELANSGEILEIISLRRNALVFTDSSIHSVTLPTATQATRVENLNDTNGILATGCAVEVDGQILVVGKDDVYLTTGTGSINSVIDQKMRDYFFGNLHTTHFAATFATHNPKQDEVWICYPTLTATSAKCNEALVYNYRHQTWSIRDMPNSRDATLDNNKNLLFTGYATASSQNSTSIHKADTTNQFNGVNFNAYVERKVLDFGDASMSKWAAEIYPLMEGSGNVEITMEGTNNSGKAVDLTGTSRSVKKQTYNIDNDYKVDNRVNGRYLNIRFSSENSDRWVLAGYSFDYTPDSRR